MHSIVPSSRVTITIKSINAIYLSRQNDDFLVELNKIQRGPIFFKYR